MNTYANARAFAAAQSRYDNAAPPKWANWTVLDAQGKALWIVYATDEQHALQQYGQPSAVAARPQAPEDRALSRRVYGSWGRLD